MVRFATAALVLYLTLAATNTHNVDAFVSSPSTLQSSLVAGQHVTTLTSTSSLSTTINTMTRNNYKNQNRILTHPPLAVSSTASPFDDPPSSSSSNESSKLNTALNSARETIADSIRTDPDVEETAIAMKNKLVQSRIKTFKVTIPLSSGNPIGLVLSPIRDGQQLDDECVLNLDTLEITEECRLASDGDENGNVDNSSTIQRLDPSIVQRKLGRDTSKGVIVSSIAKNSIAWNAGIRAGDLLLATSATMGDALWPKSTLEGVRSAVMSRKSLSSRIEFEFQRITDSTVDNQFELTLTKPIGLQLQETQDGYVEVCGFTESAPTLVKAAVQVGDRVLAVDSSIGDRMWPVSTVEGVISACTSRLPGQQITMRFERPIENMSMQEQREYVQKTEVVSASDASANTTTAKKSSQIEQEVLLSRCRQILQRYSQEQVEAAATGNDKKISRASFFAGKYSIPSLVADKVLDAIASAGASLDSVTLSMIMSAYVSCNQPMGAIRAFEAATGLHSSGSMDQAEHVIKGSENGNQLIASLNALNVVTASVLMQAHSLNGDLQSVLRILAAVEGDFGRQLDGFEVAQWPASVKPDIQCYNIALAAAAEAKTKEGLQIARDLFDRMKDRNLVTYNTLMAALSDAGQHDEVVALYSELVLPNSTIKPDKFSYTILLQSYESTGDLQEILYDMKERNVKGDIVTYNTIIKKLCNERKFVAAKRMIRQMEIGGLTPNSITYGLLMNGLLKSGNPSACLKLFQSACLDRNTAPLTENVHLYTTAITAAASLGDYDRALDLLSQMKSLGIRPNVKTMTAVMGSCLAGNQPKLAAEIFQRLDQPDGYATFQGLRAMALSGDITAAFQQLVEIKETTRQKFLIGKNQMRLCDTFVTSALQYGEYDTARTVLRYMYEKGNLLINKKMIANIIKALDLEEPTGRNLRARVPTSLANQDPEASNKFCFLLFLVDLISGRGIKFDTRLYTTILYAGANYGGLYKKIASFIIAAKKITDDANPGGKAILVQDNNNNNNNSNNAVNGAAGTQQQQQQRQKNNKGTAITNWEDFFLHYDKYKNQFGGRGERIRQVLPKLKVSVPSRDLKRVINYEQRLLSIRRPKQSSSSSSARRSQ